MSRLSALVRFAVLSIRDFNCSAGACNSSCDSLNFRVLTVSASSVSLVVLLYEISPTEYAMPLHIV